MKLSQPAMEALAFVITGDVPDSEDAAISPYRTGRALEDFFREFKPHYVPGSNPSRLNYTREMLRHHRSAGNVQRIVEAALDPLVFRNPEQPSHDIAVGYISPYFDRDGYQLSFNGGRCRVYRKGVVVDIEVAIDDDDYARTLAEYIADSERRLADGDYDGVITLARTMVEAVLLRIEAKIDDAPPKYDGDLPALYKRVSRTLNIGTDRTDVRENLKSVLRGLNHIVAGLAPYRNTAGDAHATTHRAPEHHAQLALNSARTMVEFIQATFQFQKSRGRISGA